MSSCASQLPQFNCRSQPNFANPPVSILDVFGWQISMNFPDLCGHHFAEFDSSYSLLCLIRLVVTQNICFVG